MFEVEKDLRVELTAGKLRPQAFTALLLPRIHLINEDKNASPFTPNTYLGSSRALTQTMYQFIRDYYGMNLYDDKAWEAFRDGV